MVLFNTIDTYTAIMLNWLTVACVAQWVEHVNIAHLYFLSSALLARIVSYFDKPHEYRGKYNFIELLTDLIAIVPRRLFP